MAEIYLVGGTTARTDLENYVMRFSLLLVEL